MRVRKKWLYDGSRFLYFTDLFELPGQELEEWFFPKFLSLLLIYELKMYPLDSECTQIHIRFKKFSETLRMYHQ
jgi:hypothetical protein